MTDDIQTLDGRTPHQRPRSVIVALGFAILLSLVQLYISAIVIPRFAEIFPDMLGDRPLPTSTAAVLNFRWVFAGIACVSSLVASFVIRRTSPLRYLVAILALLLFQIAFITIALFLALMPGW